MLYTSLSDQFEVFVFFLGGLDTITEASIGMGGPGTMGEGVLCCSAGPTDT